MIFIKTHWKRIVRLFGVILICTMLLGRSVVPSGDPKERVRAFTRGIDFDFVDWTLNALNVKLRQIALGTTHYLPERASNQIVLDYLNLVEKIQQLEGQISTIYTDPNVSDPETATEEITKELETHRDQKDKIAPLGEAILQDQVAISIAELGLALGGQPIPPVLYHSTPLPKALIVSPRDVIRQDHNIAISPDLTLEEQIDLEEQVAESSNVSTLVVPIGGIGTYPTMIYQTSNLNFLTEVVAHEWVHNFLSLRPLGINYLTSNELRTINETTANIAGAEIGYLLVARFYPEFLPPEPPPHLQEPEEPTPQPPQEKPEPAFDFNAEMRETRVTVDQLLEEGKIEEAEAYMERRRQMFWEQGYRIRKLNQAYFAFYGAYADTPGGGAAGADPVGEAVRTFRRQSPSLADFLVQISWVSSFQELQELLQQTPSQDIVP